MTRDAHFNFAIGAYPCSILGARVPTRIEGVEAYLPYISDGGRVHGLEIGVKNIRGLTIVVGRNASGKTAFLESIGYSISILGSEKAMARSIAMLRTLRPDSRLPALFISGLWYGDTSGAGLLVQVSDPFHIHELFKPAYGSRVGKAVLTSYIYERVVNDSSKLLTNIGRLEKREREIVLPAHRVLDIGKLPRVIRNILGANYSTYYFSSLRGELHGDLVVPFIRLFRIHAMYLAYTIRSGRPILRAVIFDTDSGILVAAKRGPKPRLLGREEVVVFHPGFAYSLSMFVAFYRESVKRGLPREPEALHLLRGFIPWFNGFELIGNELHVRSTYANRRVSIYKLSDGQRAALLLGLLYAVSPHGSMVLIDTPEAFVHPDGLATVAGLVAKMVAEGNQVIVATQSDEMLHELLLAASREGVIDDTVVKHFRIERGRVLEKGSWSGRDALDMVTDLAIDLRKV